MPIDIAQSTQSVRRALRATTADLHVELDRLVMAGDPFADEERYRSFLSLHAAARRTLRTEIGTLTPTDDAAADTAAADTALAADLARLGAHVPLPLPDRIPGEAAHLAQVLGVHYVLEGSLLGARHLSREAVARLGGDVPRSYLELGADDPDRWKRACRRLEAVAWSDTVRAGAERAFEVHLELFGATTIETADR